MFLSAPRLSRDEQLQLRKIHVCLETTANVALGECPVNVLVAKTENGQSTPEDERTGGRHAKG
ncbi:hypothetical protein B0J17DRAFT_685304 [Rhizoctonia solani]|nr:hypothetical protein B0J17DRAFT_685304 [Rhizoctonia solani]